jgi:hypothetical protein
MASLPSGWHLQSASKTKIKPMGDASEAIFALKPVTFRYEGDLDPSRLYTESISDIAKMPAIS